MRLSGLQKQVLGHPPAPAESELVDCPRAAESKATNSVTVAARNRAVIKSLLTDDVIVADVIVHHM